MPRPNPVDIRGNTLLTGKGDAFSILVDAQGKIIFSVDSGVYTGGGQGRKTIGTPGTEEALGASTAIKSIIISALPGNENPVTVGFNGVVAAAGSETGKILYSGDSVEFKINDLATVFVDVITAGDGVTYLYLT